MRAYKCDRCGTLFEAKGEGRTLSLVQQDRPLDLCGECYMSLCDWRSNPYYGFKEDNNDA